MSAIFGTSGTSLTPRRTSSSGLYQAERAAVGFEQQAAREKRARQPADSCQFSSLMPWTTVEPVQKAGLNDKANALARPSGRKRHDVFGAVVAQVIATDPAQHNAALVKESG